MLNDNEIDELIGLIYEAAIEPEKWTTALLRLRDITHSEVLQYLIVDAGTSEISLQIATEFDESATRDYVAHYWQKDPRAALTPSMRVGSLKRCHEDFDNRFVAGNEFYQDYLIPVGLRYQMGGKLMHADGSLALLAFLRGPDAGPFSDTDKGLAERLMGHLQRAARLNVKLLNVMSENISMTQAFERMQDACLVLNENSQILHANRPAERLLRDNASPLRMQERCLEIRNPSDQQLFQQAINACSNSTRQKSAPAQDAGHTIVVKRNRPFPGLVLQVLPIPPNLQPVIGLMLPAALVWIIDPLAPGKPGGDYLRVIYGLTGAEVRVAAALGQGKSLQEIADENGVSRETVKTQASAIYGKTGTKRQAELIRLVVRIQGISG